jgi:PKD repeat protein
VTPTITPAPAQVCANSTGNTASGPAGATTYAWSIVNGTISSATNIQNITYTVGASGTTDLTLVVTNAAGCSAQNTVNVTINANPVTPTITSTPAQVCANSTGNTASGPAGATTYAWSIVNGSITSAANTQNITYTAGASGTTDLTLVVTNAASCSAQNAVNVTINANPVTPTITPTPAQVCANSTGNTASGPAGATTYAWSIVNGSITSAANIQTITYTAGASGTVDLTLVVTNAATCSASNTVNVTINANPATPTITPTPAQVCANSTGNSAAGPAGATTYAWSIVNGTITSATNIQTITYTAGASGTTNVTLVVTNAAGCSASNTVNVTINPNPALAPAGATLNALYHNGFSQVFTASGGTPPYTFSISPMTPPAGLSFTPGATTATLSGSAPTLPNTTTNGAMFTVTVTDANNCSASQMYTLVIRPNTVADMYMNGVGNTQYVITGYTPAPTTPAVSNGTTVIANDDFPGRSPALRSPACRLTAR